MELSGNFDEKKNNIKMEIGSWIILQNRIGEKQ